MELEVQREATSGARTGWIGWRVVTCLYAWALTGQTAQEKVAGFASSDFVTGLA